MSHVPLTLEDVFSFWRANEAWNEKWQKVAAEKGFSSWEEWRQAFLQVLGEATEAGWELREINDPLSVIPTFFGGPFKAWKENVYGEKETWSFAEIVATPFVESHDYIQELVKNFPPLTVISTVEDEAGRIFVVEGMHRACALALMAKEGKKYQGILCSAHGKLKPDHKLSFEHLSKKPS